MRYLYGDLTEFPNQDNVLDLLQRFVDMAVEVLRIDYQVGRELELIEQDRAFINATLHQIGEFHEVVRKAILEAAADQPPEHVVPVLAKGAAANLDHFIDESKKKIVSKVEDRIHKTEGAIVDLQRQIHAHLKTFFLKSAIPIAGNSLQAEIQDGVYVAASVILDVIGLRCSYQLDTGLSEFFSEPRRLSTLAPERLDLPVGLRKAWLKKEPVVETMRIDDAQITAVTDTEKFGEIKLTRKGGNGTEGVRIRVGKKDRDAVEVIRIDPVGQELAVPDDLILPEHRERLVQVWKQLNPHLVALYRDQGDLTAIRIDREDVIDERRLTELVDRFVRFLVPIIHEITIRSPAKTELCLKVEHEGGRREEIYIQKEDLVRKLVTLPLARRALFSALDLDDGLEGLKLMDEDLAGGTLATLGRDDSEDSEDTGPINEGPTLPT